MKSFPFVCLVGIVTSLWPSESSAGSNSSVRAVISLTAALYGADGPAANEAGVPQPADIVFRNGGVYTVDATRRWAEAVAVRDGRIVFVGTNADVASRISSRTRVVDLRDKMLLPG